MKSQTTRIDQAVRAFAGQLYDMHTCSPGLQFHIQRLDTKQKQLVCAIDVNCQNQPCTSTDIIPTVHSNHQASPRLPEIK